MLSKKLSALEQWISGDIHLHSVNFFGLPLKRGLEGHLNIDVVVPVHESLTMRAESLEFSGIAHANYIRGIVSMFGERCRVIDENNPFWIAPEEADAVIAELGLPPKLCYPIYLITVDDGRKENIVYVGKTSSRRGRFSGGHAAHTKLLNPIYDGMSKKYTFVLLVFWLKILPTRLLNWFARVS